MASNKEEPHTETYHEEQEWKETIFETVFFQYYARVVGVLFRLIGNRTQAEELANDVFWKLYQNPLSSTSDHNLGGWLYRTAINLGISILRAEKRRRRYEQMAGVKQLIDKPPPDPLDEILRAEQRQRVRNVLAKLKPAQVQILVLRSNGFSYKEIATALEIKVAFIGTLLARAEVEFEKEYYKLYGDKE